MPWGAKVKFEVRKVTRVMFMGVQFKPDAETRKIEGRRELCRRTMAS